MHLHTKGPSYAQSCRWADDEYTGGVRWQNGRLARASASRWEARAAAISDCAESHRARACQRKGKTSERTDVFCVFVVACVWIVSVNVESTCAGTMLATGKHWSMFASHFVYFSLKKLYYDLYFNLMYNKCFHILCSKLPKAAFSLTFNLFFNTDRTGKIYQFC